MAKSKYHHYVLVCTTTGAKFVTELCEHHTCCWDADKKPLEMNAQWAEDVALGLCMNFNLAFHIKVPYEIETQPYRYDRGHFEWVQNDTEN